MHWSFPGAAQCLGLPSAPPSHALEFGFLSFRAEEWDFTQIVTSECERQSWYTEAELLGHAAAGTHSLECFEFFGMWASQAETKTGICITSVTTEAKSVTVDGRQIMTYAVRAQNSKKCHTLSILKKQKIKAIHTDLSIQHISNAFLSIWEGILVVVGLIERWSPL